MLKFKKFCKFKIFKTMKFHYGIMNYYLMYFLYNQENAKFKYEMIEDCLE